MQGPRSYFASRAEEERDAADCAADPRARDKHLELARRYDGMADRQPPELAADGSISPIVGGLGIL